jgi:putative membrane protein
MIILILKTLHVIAIVVWTGVLLYMPRLLIYQTEANSKTEPERSILINQYKLMSKRLWTKVGWPAMGLTVLFGLGIMHPYFSSIWFWVKMGFVVALIAYHHMIHFANKNLQKDNYKKSIDQIKSMSQVGMVLIASIITLAVLKDTLNDILLIAGIGILVVLVFIAGRAMLNKTTAK